MKCQELFTAIIIFLKKIKNNRVCIPVTVTANSVDPCREREYCAGGATYVNQLI